METDTLMHHARKMNLLADEYSFLQDYLARGPEDIQWLAFQVSDVRVSLIRMSQSLQGIALDRTREKLRQLELDYDSGDLCKTRE